MSERGTLVVIGGAEDKKDRCTILKRFVSLAQGRQAAIAIITAAAQEPVTVGAEYEELFDRLGARDIRVINITTRAEANGKQVEQQLREASGIFFTGGDQLRITALLGGTRVYRALHEAHQRGIAIAGTSAGASAMSEVMIVGGANDSSPRRGTVSLAPGLGLLRGVVIDQHFAQRGRLGRLLSCIAHNPHVLGVGIDENTAIVVDPQERVLEVIGEGTTTFVDGSNITFSNVSESTTDEALALVGCRLHILPNGYRFDLAMRKAIHYKAANEGDH